KQQKALQKELEWINSSQKARHAKGKARVTNYQQKFEQEKEREQRNETHELFIPSGRRLGDRVISFKGVSKGFDDKLLYEDLTFELPPGGIVGVIGANGAGKTTLFRMITGEEEPNSGTIEMGETVDLSYVDQGRMLDASKTIFEVVGGGLDTISLGGREVNTRAYISKFNFTGDDHHKKVGELSGGERNRIHLATMLKDEGNVLLLDEPTNDLDVNTLRALEEALMDYAGCAVVISHDRYFLDRVATHMLAFEGDSQVVYFDGNFSEYEEDKRKRLGDEASRPHRCTYKKLTR
ncbi:MAG: ATP-binding cassette domain-containing protein, partial [Bdellovibrionales bacterium]|nr:ATP-binding cassette domain-containing protein [Bdellovibrionales bacterium]